MEKNIVSTVQEIIGLNNPQFASFTYLSKTDNSIARYTVILGSKYINLLEKSITALEILINGVTDRTTLEFQAMTEVMASLQKSLTAHKAGTQSEDYTKKGQYTPIHNGLNVNTTDNSLQLFGLLQSKVVLKAGDPRKPVKSKPLTVAKNKVRKELPISKFREFALDCSNVESARINGEVLEITPSLAQFAEIGFDLSTAAPVVETVDSEAVAA
jgi:hypothetical protein